jgi:crotonobetainyl-CoA:carnitine CoA-transferase CaiB-like acyl-CoA transferase
LRESERTGRGGIVDASLFETTLAWMTLPITTYLANGEIPKRFGSGIEQIVPYQAFAAADGHIMVAAGNDNLFRRLAAAIGRPGLAEEARFRTNADRVKSRAALTAILDDIFAAEPIAVWARRLEAAGIPNGPIHSVDQVVADAQTAALGMIQHMRGSALSLIGLPLSFDGTRPPLKKLAPKLGEDNRAILDGPE